MTVQTEETASDIRYLESVTASLEMAETEQNLSQIRSELQDAGYIRFPFYKTKRTTAPVHSSGSTMSNQIQIDSFLRSHMDLF